MIPAQDVAESPGGLRDGHWHRASLPARLKVRYDTLYKSRFQGRLRLFYEACGCLESQ